MKRHFKYESELKGELEHLLNKYGVDNELNTPDFILVEYLIQTLDTYRDIQNRVEMHHDLVESLQNTIGRNKTYNGRIVKITEENYRRLEVIKNIDNDTIYILVEKPEQENWQEQKE